MEIKSIAVYCGARSGNHKIFVTKAKELGTYIAKMDFKLVYGGGKYGLMGAVSDAALKAGGKVTGVLPHFLSKKEIPPDDISELIMVETMHERKLIMSEKSDAIIALPGGYGTMEELFEMLTWSQLGLHKKPVGMLNVNGFYDHLFHFLDKMNKSGFLSDIDRSRILFSDNPKNLIDLLLNYEPPPTPKWLESTQT